MFQDDERTCHCALDWKEISLIVVWHNYTTLPTRSVCHPGLDCFFPQIVNCATSMSSRVESVGISKATFERQRLWQWFHNRNQLSFAAWWSEKRIPTTPTIEVWRSFEVAALSWGVIAVAQYRWHFHLCKSGGDDGHTPSLNDTLN